MILVTGGTGLVGSHLLFDLIQSGENVRALKRDSSSAELVKKIFSIYSSDADLLFDKIEWMKGDITEIYSLYEAMQDVEKVYHAAAVVSFHAADYNEMMKINVDGTANVVNACLHKNIKKLCFVSSIATLGRKDNDELIDEETRWKNSITNSAYSISKYGAEREVWRGITEGLSAVIVNPAVIIGPGDWRKGSSQIFEQVWNGLRYFTNGMNGYVDVRDVVKCMIYLMNSEVSNSRFIVSSENLSYFELFSMIAEDLGKKKPSVKANAFLSQLAWRLEWFRSKLTGKKPLITKETARTAFQRYQYSTEKIKKTTGIKFIPIHLSIQENCKQFLKEKN